MFGLNKSKLTSTNRTSQYIWHIPKKYDTWNLKHPQIKMVGWLSFEWRTKSWLTWTNEWLSPFPSIQKKIGFRAPRKNETVQYHGFERIHQLHHQKSSSKRVGWGSFLEPVFFRDFLSEFTNYHLFDVVVCGSNVTTHVWKIQLQLFVGNEHVSYFMHVWLVCWHLSPEKNSFSIITPWPFLQPLTPWPILWLC